MSLRSDQRGQAIQVGAVLLFAVLIIAFSTYQAVMIPADNRRVEFNHNQEVQDHLADLRSAVLGTVDATSVRSVTIALGTTYPSRTLGLNPNSPSGSLRTVGTTNPMVNLTIENAEARGETEDFWNGTARSYNTGAIEYTPNYNRYDEAPTTAYEHSLLYNRFPNSNALVLGNQTLVDGDRLSIVTINGSVDRTSSRSTAVDVRPVSNSGGRVSVYADEGPITLNFSSQLPWDRWDAVVPDRHNVSEGTFPSPEGFNSITVELDEREDGYRLGMAKAGVGQGVTEEEAAYLTDLDGPIPSIPRGTNRSVTLAVRDAFNNPVAGVNVNASVTGTNSGSLDAQNATSDVDGEVVFRYDSRGARAGRHEINVTLGESTRTENPSFEPGTPENVTTTIEVYDTGGDEYDGNGGVLEPVEVRDSTANRLVFRIENIGSESVTVEGFSVDVTAVGTNPNTRLDNGNRAEVEILRTSVQNGDANRNGSPTVFDVDGTYYDFVADSNQGNAGSYATIASEDDTVDVDLRQFQPGISELRLADSATAADAQVTLRLSDGTDQVFYFEAT